MFGLIFLFGVLFFFMLMVSENGISFAVPKKMLCRMGLHKIRVRKINKYYCQYCKTPRKHPKLKIVDGGNKIGNTEYKF